MSALSGRTAAVFAAIVLATLASWARAQSDHLECHQIKDDLHLKGVVDLASPELGLAPGCKISTAKFFCTSTSKTIVSAIDAHTKSPIVPLPVTGSDPGDRICYVVKCPAVVLPDRLVTDQFGTRDVRRFKAASLLCTPVATTPPACGGPVPPDDPPAIPCSGVAMIPGGTINISQTWPASCEIQLDGVVQVAAGVVIKVQPGTVVKGRKEAMPFAALVFQQDSTIDANGTQQCPIVFTSDQPIGSRAAGDWAGITIDGRASVNRPSSFDFYGNPYGGGNDANSSGTLRYVRIEFAGHEFTPADQEGGLDLNAVGSGTHIDHVQSHMAILDAFSFQGGTVNASHLVATAPGRASFDWQLGYTGAMQYAYAAQLDTQLSTVVADNGLEGDNSEFDFNTFPRSAPRLCNATLVGAKGQTGPAVTAYGALLRRGTLGRVANSIVFNSTTAGEQLRDAVTANLACGPGPTLTGALNFQNSFFFDNGPSGSVGCAVDASTAGANCDSCSLLGLWTAQATAPSSTATDPGFPATTGTVWPPLDPIPGAAAGSTAFDCATLHPSFETTSYVGAFAPGAPSWLTTPWIAYDTN
jgi:hypothetical protein